MKKLKPKQKAHQVKKARKANYAEWLRQDIAKEVSRLNSEASAHIADAGRAAAIKTKIDTLLAA